VKKLSFQMSQELHQDLCDEAERLETSKASICREAVNHHLRQRNGWGKDLEEAFEELHLDRPAEVQPPEEPSSAEHSSEPDEQPKLPWYVRYQDKVNNFHTGGAPPRRSSPTLTRYDEDRDDLTELWSR
jgi:predicted DNA-binding protein